MLLPKLIVSNVVIDHSCKVHWVNSNSLHISYSESFSRLGQRNSRFYRVDPVGSSRLVFRKITTDVHQVSHY